MYLYLLHNKNEALDAFKVFKAEVEKQCGKQINIVRSDRGCNISNFLNGSKVILIWAIGRIMKD